MAEEKLIKRKWKTRKERRNRSLKIAGAVIGLLLLIFVFLYLINQIQSVEIEGNEYYTDEELQALIINEPLEQNAWFLYLKYNYLEPEEIPFIDTIEVELTGTGQVKITVYEKGIVGYVEYLGNYMYFDKDGIVVESSKVQMEGSPMISGLGFENIVLHEALPVQNENVFDSILNLTQLLRKNELWPDKIHFNQSDEIVLYFNEAKVLLGTDELLAEKVKRLTSIISDVQGRSGTLHLENFDEDTKNITFENAQP